MNFVASHQIRSEFSALMSQMYREEVPLNRIKIGMGFSGRLRTSKPSMRLQTYS